MYILYGCDMNLNVEERIILVDELIIFKILNLW